MSHKTTRQVCEQFGVLCSTVPNLVRSGRLRPPAKLGSVYAWTEDDVQRLRAALAVDRRRRPDAVPAA